MNVLISATILFAIGLALVLINTFLTRRMLNQLRQGDKILIAQMQLDKAVLDIQHTTSRIEQHLKNFTETMENGEHLHDSTGMADGKGTSTPV